MYFDNCQTLDEAKKLRNKLLFNQHPDVSKSSVDTTETTQKIISAYSDFLNKLSFKNKTNYDVELRKNENLYVVVYKCVPRYKNGRKCYDMGNGIKSILVKDDDDAERVIKNLKALKIYTPFLSDTKFDKCDTIGYVYGLVHGGYALKNIFYSNIKTNEHFRPVDVIHK